MTLAIGAAVPSLTRWGMTSDADLVFRTLTTFGGHTVRMLSKELGMPVRRVEHALAELRTAGAVTRMPFHALAEARQPVWASLPPDVVVTALRMRRLQTVNRPAQIDAHRRIVRSIQDRLGPAGLSLSASAVGGLVADDIRYLPTRAATRVRLAELIVGCREIMTINVEQSYDAESLRAGVAGYHTMSEQGTRSRIVSPPRADRDQLAPFVEVPGMQSRETPDVPLKLLMLDRKVATIMADPDDMERGYIEITRAPVVDELMQLFERHWATAVDPLHSGVVPIVLSDRERALVALLAQAHTDVTAAAALQISARSVTNVLRALMDRVGVENRFQLGLALGSLRVAAPPALTLDDSSPG